MADNKTPIQEALQSLLSGLDWDTDERKDPQHVGEIEAMGGLQATIYGEATGAKRLAGIIRGESDRGWLPSWRW